MFWNLESQRTVLEFWFYADGSSLSFVYKIQAEMSIEQMTNSLNVICLPVISVRLLHAERHPAVNDTAGGVYGWAGDAVPGASCGRTGSAGPRLIVYEGQFAWHCAQCPLRLSSHSGWQVFHFKVVYHLVQRLLLVFFCSKLRSSREPWTVHGSVFWLKFKKDPFWFEGCFYFGRPFFFLFCVQFGLLVICWWWAAHRIEAPKCPCSTMRILFLIL